MTVAETPKVHPESRLLIDGKLVEAVDGKTFDNVNPATEEVLGQVADASADDMRECHRRGPAGVRRKRLVDRPGVPPAVPRPAAGSPRGRAGGVAGGADPRGRLPPDAHLRTPARCPPRRGAELPGSAHRRVRLGDRTGRAVDFRGTNERPPDRQGTGRRGRGHRPVELSRSRSTLTKVGQALATGNTVVLKPAPDTPWNATLVGRLVAEKTDIPPGVLNVVDLLGSHGRRGADSFPRGRPHLLHRLDRVVGKRIMEKGAATLKRLFLELGGKSATIVLDDADFSTGSAVRAGRVLPRRAGMRHPDPDAPAPVPLSRRVSTPEAPSCPGCPTATRSGPT